MEEGKVNLTTEQLRKARIFDLMDRIADSGVEFRKDINRWEMHGRSENIAAMDDLINKGLSTHAKCRISNYIATTPEQEQFVRTMREYGENIRDHFNRGTNVILCGNPGTGKDHMLMGLARHAFADGLWVTWLNGMQFRQIARDVSKGEESFDLYCKQDILWLSDIAVESMQLTGFQKECLYEVIDHRYRMKLPTWVSMNFANREHAENLIGQLNYDRLRDKATAFNCDWESYRDIL